MIPFNLYYSVIVEGGNVFKANPTQRINLQNIAPTVDFVSKVLGVNLSRNLLGSTGKRASSGDIDIAVDGNKITKEEAFNRLKAWCEERNLDSRLYVAKSGISVHFRAPISGEVEQYVQVDLMIVDDVKWAQFVLSNDEPAPYKGMHRAVLLSGLAKNINMKWSINGITDRVTNAVIENKNPDRAAQILLGDPRAKAKNLFNIKSILDFLMKKYQDVNVVLAMVDQARQTIMKDGVDIAEFLPSNAPQKLQESSTASGQRVGVQHLYSEYKSDDYSMSFENFKQFLEELRVTGGIIDPGNSVISEKADGMAVRFGIDANDKFFLQGSYSGPVTDGNFEGKIKHEPTQKAFEEGFSVIKKHTEKMLMKYKKDNGLDSLRVQAEWLYSSFALDRDTSGAIVYFVATNYERDKLGKWSTFPIIAVTDNGGEDIPADIAYNIIHDLVRSSDDNIKFLPLDVDTFNAIDLRGELTGAESELSIFYSQYPDYEEVLYSTGRSRVETQARKEMRAHLTRILHPWQKKMQDKILIELDKVAGKIGEVEGFVIKVNSNNPFVFKVISPAFHKNKGRI